MWDLEVHKDNFPESQTFINRCLRRIFKILWPETNLNEHLWQMAKKKPITQQIKGRKWIGHTLRKDTQATDNWNPQGRLKR
jgi:hypothetical protein